MLGVPIRRWSWRKRSRALAFSASLLVFAAALIFCMLFVTETIASQHAGARWFAYSGFPLIIVALLASCARLQRRLDLKISGLPRETAAGSGPRP